MLFKAKISNGEEALLTQCVGEQLRIVSGDRWAAELQTPELVIGVFPEEIETPDDEHPHADVDRIAIERRAATIDSEPPALAIRELGLILEINVISLLVSFSPSQPAEPVALPSGAVVPEGESYGLVYHSSDADERAVLEHAKSAAIVDVDVALEILLKGQRPLILYTGVCGHYVEVSQDGLPEGEDWVRLGEFKRRGLPSGA